MNKVFSNASALVAIGMNGDMVILSVADECSELRNDAAELPANIALTISKSLPQLKPGLYEFKGSSFREEIRDFGSAVLHRGHLELVSSLS